MLANYGYKDASGDFFITINTNKCDGCGDCVDSCQAGIFIVLKEDPNDPMRDEPVASISEKKIKKLKYECNLCKAKSNSSLSCINSCTNNAILHSW